MKKILFVSYDQFLLNTVKTELSSWNFIVKTSQNPNELFDELNYFEPDLLIIDFILNDVNGGTLSRQVKSNALTQHIPVIILTDYPELVRFSNKFGCDVMLNKPVRMPELANAAFLLTSKSESYLNRAS